MTIPIQAPHIDPPLFQRMGGEEGLAPLIQALEFAKTAGQVQQRIDTENAQRQTEAAQRAQAAQDQADGTKAFYDHLSGTTARGTKPGPNGEQPPSGIDQNGFLTPLPQVERGLSPGAHATYMGLIQQHNAGVQQQQEGAQREVATAHDKVATALAVTQQQAADQKRADDLQTRQILARWGDRIKTDAGQRGAIAEVLTKVGPDAAKDLAPTLNVGAGRYGHVVVGGQLYIVDTKTGTSHLDATSSGTNTALSQQRMQAIQRNAGTIVDLLEAEKAIAKGPEGLAGTKNPAAAELLQQAHTLGLSGAPLANFFRDDNQQYTQMLRTRFAHNYVGLLPNARSAAQLLDNLTQSYWAPAGSSPATLRKAQQDRERLERIMIGVRDGKITDLHQIPGFDAAANAAVAEQQQVQPTDQPANPDEFYHS